MPGPIWKDIYLSALIPLMLTSLSVFIRFVLTLPLMALLFSAVKGLLICLIVAFFPMNVEKKDGRWLLPQIAKNSLASFQYFVSWLDSLKEVILILDQPTDEIHFVFLQEKVESLGQFPSTDIFERVA